MPVELNHTIVSCRDNVAASRHVASLLGLPEPTRFGPFMVVETSNGVSLDYLETTEPIHGQHYAFLVSDSEFDEILGRIQRLGIDYWADPGRRRTGEINRNDGGRGIYFPDLDDHSLEIITVPYGGG